MDLTELNVLELAVQMHVNPAEIFEQWDSVWVNKLLIYTNARAMPKE